MKRILQIGWKDLRVIFRDRAALILMLVAPFVLTVAMGLVTGSLGSSSSGINQVSVVVVNLDQSTLGNALVEQLKSPQLTKLLAVQESSDVAVARASRYQQNRRCGDHSGWFYCQCDPTKWTNNSSKSS
jgi:ABC-2 type transport system permease protein